MMKASVLILLSLLSYAAAYDVHHVEETALGQLEEQDPVEIAPYGILVDGKAKKTLNNFLIAMPCGFPEHGIPPLSPYTNADLTLDLTKSIADVVLQFLRFRLDGLERMEIKKLKVNYVLKKDVKFHFNFRELRATAHTLNSNVFLDYLRQLGISVRYEGSGPMEFALENLSIKGQFKYKMPLIFGSAKIYKFEAVVHLGSVRSNIGGILGDGALNRRINDIIEYEIPALINGRQREISDRIEAFFVPFANERLKGHKLWYVLDRLSQKPPVCNPAPPPW